MTKYARDYLLAKEQYEMAVRIEIRSAPVFEDKEIFWRMADDLAACIIRHIEVRDDAVSRGIEDLLNHTKRHGCEFYTLEDFPSFIATYSKLKNKLARKLKDKIEENFSSLVDSMPLVGKKACLRVIAGEVKDAESLAAIIGEDHMMSFVRFIVNKENFVEQQLEQKYSDLMAPFLALEGDDADGFLLELEKIGVVMMPQEANNG